MKSLLLRWAVFVALGVTAMLLARDWRPADHWLFAHFFMPANDQSHPGILLVELPDVGADDLSSRAFRELLAATLQQLALRGPEQVAVDVAVLEGGAALPALTDAVAALLKARVKVYFGVHPGLDASQPLAAAIYRDAGLTGVGHTQLHLGGGLVFFPSVVDRPGSGAQLAFLPALLAGKAVPDPFSLPPQQVIRVPRHGRLADKLLLTEHPDWAAVLPRTGLAGRTVIVASSARECRQPGEASICKTGPGAVAWSGPELLVWALTDLWRGRDAGATRPVDRPAWVLVAALSAAATGLVAHLLGLRLAGRHWAPSLLARRLWLVDALAFSTVLAMLAVAEWLLIQLGWLLPPTFPVLATLIAVGVCHWHSRAHLGELLAALTRHASAESLASELDVFISYSHAPGNAAWVEQHIVGPLRKMTLADGRPLRLFFDQGSITVGQDWFRRINLGILGSRCFLCVWSDDYLERDYCRWEIDYGFPLAARRNFLFLPVAHLSAGATPGPAYAPYMQVRQYVDAALQPDFMATVQAALRAHLVA